MFQDCKENSALRWGRGGRVTRRINAPLMKALLGVPFQLCQEATVKDLLQEAGGGRKDEDKAETTRRGRNS